MVFFIILLRITVLCPPSVPIKPQYLIKCMACFIVSTTVYFDSAFPKGAPGFESQVLPSVTGILETLTQLATPAPSQPHSKLRSHFQKHRPDPFTLAAFCVPCSSLEELGGQMVNNWFSGAAVRAAQPHVLSPSCKPVCPGAQRYFSGFALSHTNLPSSKHCSHTGLRGPRVG